MKENIILHYALNFIIMFATLIAFSYVATLFLPNYKINFGEIGLACFAYTLGKYRILNEIKVKKSANYQDYL